jgi:hypothetical protein
VTSARPDAFWQERRIPLRRWWIVVVYVLFFVALNWPVLALANRVEPRIAGMPFLIAWYLFWSSCTAVFHLIVLFSRTDDPVAPEPPSEEGVQ